MHVKYKGPSRSIHVDGVDIPIGGVGEVSDAAGVSLIASGDFEKATAAAVKKAAGASEQPNTDTEGDDQ